MTLKIGLTGGIGSGKSFVAKIFTTLNIPVYDADESAKQLMNESVTIRQQLTEAFGKNAYKNGTLNRAYIASIVFKDKAKLSLLNSIIHPATIRDAENWFIRQTSPYAIKEAALLFESGSAQLMDYTIMVSAPETLRIERTIRRDATTQEKVLERMRYQLPEEEKISKSDFILINDEKQALLPQVFALHEKLLQLTV